jgi:ATP-dependent DNA helicase DinG
MSSSSTRFSDAAAQTMRAAIEEAGGVEVFAIGTMDGGGLVESLEIHCRGNRGAVPALLSRPRPGQVVIHNHPSGVLEASNADMYLANLYGEDGIGVAIVDNAVERALWVVEPHFRELKRIEVSEIEEFFLHRLPVAMPGYESRKGQLEMSLQVAEALNQGEVALLEAGTGTGKSLAYLLPSVLWALKNETRVVVATYTINLQGQLVNSDLPVLRAAGLDFEHALIKGRGNYICRRRLGAALEQDPDDATLKAIGDYALKASDGTRSDLAFPVPDEVWDQVLSDHDQTLRARCPHFNECFYYEARRRAAKAHILVANHHLLLIDMQIKGETGGEGILPRFNRAVIDEGHHLEDAATSMLRQQLSSRMVRRSLTPLRVRKNRPGVLERVAQGFGRVGGPLFEDSQIRVIQLTDEISGYVRRLWDLSEIWFQEICSEILDTSTDSFRLRPEFSSDPRWRRSIEPTLKRAARLLGRTSDRLVQLEEVLAEADEEELLRDPQAILDLRRVRRKLASQSGFLQLFCQIGEPGQTIQDDPVVRWIERARGKLKVPSASLSIAPVEVGPTLRQQLFSRLKSVTSCSATLAVDQAFDHYQLRVGLAEPSPLIRVRSAILPTPFDYRKQAMLCLPSGLPDPNSQDFAAAVSPFIIDAVRACGGGVFVLCTSFKLLRRLHADAEARLGGRHRVLRQGEMGRQQLLETFISTPDSVLFGADSFWEGVSVKGKALRLVIIPRLPFRVPTDPVQEARYELIEAQGGNPFTHYSLPQAALRLRQGFGRLIRTRQDRGAVVILDGRIRSKWYGRTFLASLPAMERIVGGTEVVLARLRNFFGRSD